MFKTALKDSMVYMLGGRAAEEIIFGDFTTGAGNDLQRATQMAQRMVCEFGMSDVLGPRTFGDPNGNGQVFLGRDYGASDRAYSDATARIIDEEIKKIIDEAHSRAVQILTDRKDILVRVAEALIERETLDGSDLDLLIKGEPLPDLPEEPQAPAPTPTPEEKKRRETKLFGKSILDRPKELPSS
jgi:cell division protease FtsH